MKKVYLLKLTIIAALITGFNFTVFAQALIPTTFHYTGTVQTYVVPTGVTQVSVDLTGGCGGAAYNCCTSQPVSLGGRTQAVVNVTGGQTLYIYVGQAGTNWTSGIIGAGTVFNGGGGGGSYAACGGGATDIRNSTAGYSSSTVIAVAGAGGGGGDFNTAGGCGGAAIGGSGGNYGSGAACGGGQTGPSCTTGSALGTQGVGGTPGAYSEGGGGGGWWGGNGGTSDGGGAGGSDYENPSYVASYNFTQCYSNASGNGIAIITPLCAIPVAGSIVGVPTGPICTAGTSFPLTFTGSSGGSWYSSNSAVATITNLGVVTTVGAGTATISYGLTVTCGMTSTVTVVSVLPTPTAIFPTGSGAFCAGTTKQLNNSDPTTGTWTTSNPILASVSSSGLVTGLGPGNPVITYVEADGCSTSYTTTINPAPYGIGGVPSTGLCVGSNVTLTDASAGGTWSAGNSLATVGSTTGVVHGVNPGGAIVSYTLAGCSVSATIPVSSLPDSLYSISPSSSINYICAGSSSGVNLTLSHSDIGVSYQLTNSITGNVGSALTGTGGSLSFPNQTAAGNYTIIGKNAGGCTDNMAGVATVSVTPAPTVYALTATGGGAYCSSSPSGVDLILANSTAGNIYYLYEGGTLVTYTVSTGGPIDWGTVTGGTFTGGSYFVIAIAPSGCTDTMSGRPTVTMYISPEVDTVTVSNGGSYCMGGTGVHVGLNNSTSGVNYQLYNGITPVYSVGGNNSSLDFGGNYLTGTYSVIATNPVSGCMTTMFNTPTVFTNPLPTAYTVDVANSGVRCYGSAPLAISLSSSDFGITYQLYMGSTMIGIPLAGGTGDTVFGNYYTAGNYTVVATNQGTGCTSNMSGTATITVNPLPTAETVSGGGNYCAGSTTGTSVMLGGSQSGVLYSLMNGGSTIDTIRRSMGGAFNFPADTMTGYYTVQATSSAGCTSMMTGGTTILANPLPEMDTVTGGGAYCIGGSGQHVGLNFSSLGINYQLYYGGVATGSPVAGSNAAIDFGAKTAAGNYTVMATNITTSCSSAMSGPVTVSINPLPNAYSVTGGGSFCAGGTGVAVGIMTSNTGINYQLYNGATMVGSPVAGTGTTLSFGNQTNAGTYTVIGTNATTGCTMNMTGSEAVSINALPTSYNVTGGGNFCSGGTGVHIGINGSNTGVSYQLYNGTTMVGTAMTGTGSSLDFGAVTTGGSYTVSANNTTTFCSSDMGGSASVIVNPLPTVYTVTGGGNYCSGSTGVHVGLSGSNTGLSYQLYNGASMVGSPVTGLSGSLLDFGLITTPGTYTVDATNSITGCTSAMSGSKTIGINTLPMAYTVTGGGSVCAGAEGVAVNLSGSVTGINYILMNGGSTVNTLSGTGGALNFGLETTSGTYTVMASNPSTSCTSNMLSSANVVVNPLPDVYAVTGGGSYCSGGTGVNIGLIGSGYGINYQLMNGGTMVNVPVGGTGSALTFPGLFTMAGSYTVVASNTTTGCINNMSSSAVVTVTPTVIPSVAVVSASGDSVCEGTAVNYTATVTNGGTSPVYVWLVNGSAMGSGASFVYVPANGDMITAQITSNAACATPATVSSATTMTVINYVLPVANITAAPGSIVCPSTSVTYTATTENGGSAPYIAWLVDSAYTGDVSSSYTYTPSNGDAVMLMLVSNQKCRSMDTVYSHDILMTIVPPFTPSFSISSHLGPVIGVGQSDTLRALVTDAGILSLTYQWYINGNLVYGATTERLIADTVFNNDTVTCIVSGEGLCGTSSGTSGIRIHLENLGVQTVSVAGDIKLMPNPNKGDFTISGTLGTADNEEVTLEVTNMLGQVVYTDKVTATGGAINKHIQLNSGLANGMYLLNLRSESKNAVVHFVMEQ